MLKITEIIPEGIFLEPYLKQAFEEGRVFNVMLAKIKELEAENSRYRVSKENLARLLRSPVVSHADIKACFEGGSNE